jgi:hypothetical protein
MDGISDVFQTAASIKVGQWAKDEDEIGVEQP